MRKDDVRKSMTIHELNHLVTIATAPGRMYRKLYGMNAADPALRIDSFETWSKLPFLTKEHLLQTPISERIFLPLSDVDYIVPSSGTIGGLPLFSPRAHLAEYQFRSRFCSTPKAALSSKLVPHQQEELLRLQGGAPLIVLDLVNPAICARLAARAGIDSLYVMTSHVMTIAPHLAREGAAEGIRYIEMAGEACSHALFSYIRKTFPKAVIVSSYGITDVENSAMGIPCRPMSERGPLEVYHANDGCYLELIDPETGQVLPITQGTEGEVVISAYRGEPAALPMVRYRSGDIARVVEEACAEHGQWTFMLLGRAAMDFIRIPGGVLQADEVERVLRTMSDRVSDRFELHTYETSAPHGIHLRAVLHVESKGENVDLDTLARDIAGLLRISPTVTFAEGTARGRFDALECVPLAIPESSKKRRRMIPHKGS